MNSLKGKVAIITGGANGIGLATAKLFLEEGANVALVDIDIKGLKKAEKYFNTSKLLTFKADVSKCSEVKKYVSYVLDAFGKIDIFFNNAGIEGTSRPISEYPEEIFDRVMAINLKGVWLGCQEVIPKMNDGGSVIITSSVAGLKGFEGLAPYVASKHAVVGIMRSAALEFASRKIRVNTIHPGPVNNEMMRRIEKDISPENPNQAKSGFESAVPFGRYAESKEIAQTVLFLASEQSKFITGCTHLIDGGMLAG
ncbi:short chain dehydrogenase [Croceivirga lutea]|uniref:SDR family NAD(P)-dependent oxidoreductase n=1 Tax=Croceivirga lutea TaxID=1775167 RepID=UPI00163AE300|nr:SDR family oxidoreductase [Croceivirga lutea]GGG43202.1 short chain dehydrogenase [Croceivirga lutea]